MGTSICQSSYVHHRDGKASTIDAAIHKDLRSHHFTFGDDDYTRGISTTSRDALTYHGRVESGMDPAMKDDLRAVHFILGNENAPAKSNYQESFQRRRIPDVLR